MFVTIKALIYFYFLTNECQPQPYILTPVDHRAVGFNSKGFNSAHGLGLNLSVCLCIFTLMFTTLTGGSFNKTSVVKL